jgi:hypothetical protein
MNLDGAGAAEFYITLADGILQVLNAAATIRGICPS